MGAEPLPTNAAIPVYASLKTCLRERQMSQAANVLARESMMREVSVCSCQLSLAFLTNWTPPLGWRTCGGLGGCSPPKVNLPRGNRSGQSGSGTGRPMTMSALGRCCRSGRDFTPARALNRRGMMWQEPT